MNFGCILLIISGISLSVNQIVVIHAIGISKSIFRGWLLTMKISLAMER